MNTRAIIAITASILFITSTALAAESLKLSSPAFEDDGVLPTRFTCDGDRISPPLSWSGAPEGTQSLVLIMDHIPDPQLKPKLKPKPVSQEANAEGSGPQQPEPGLKDKPLRWYWTMYNIPANVSEVAAGEAVGTLGTNVVNNSNEYAPPCSKGPGLKHYIFHLYALSDVMDLAHTQQVTEAVVRESMRELVLDSTSITVGFERSSMSPPPPPPEDPTAKATHLKSERNITPSSGGTSY